MMYRFSCVWDLIVAWIYLLLAGLLEIGFTTALRLSEGFSKLGPSLAFFICAALSFLLLQKATVEIPLGTAYAVWTGIGAVGTFILGIILLGEPAQALRFLFVGFIIVGIIGLKLVSA